MKAEQYHFQIGWEGVQ